MLLVFVGLSGSGKDTVRRAFLKKHPDFSSLMTLTTRPERMGETDDIHNVISEQEFRKAISNGELLEYVNFAGHYYGTPVAAFKESLEKVAEGQNVAYLIDPYAAVNLENAITTFFGEDPEKSKKILSNLLIVLIDVSKEEAKNRALNRGTPQTEIDERMLRDIEIIEKNPNIFKNKIENKMGNLDSSVKQLEELIANFSR